jgi:hypothetical protein
VYSEVVEIYIFIVVAHGGDVELLLRLGGKRFFLLSGLLVAGFLKSFLFGGLHPGDGFLLGNLSLSLLRDGCLLFLFGLFLLVVLIAVFLLHLSFHELDEWFEDGLHLLIGLTVVHARVLVQAVVLTTVPVGEEFSAEELSVVESLAEGWGLLLHGRLSLSVEN